MKIKEEAKVKVSYKDNVFDIWYTGIPKKELSYKIPLEEIQKELFVCVNSNFALATIVGNSLLEATYCWIADTKDVELKAKRAASWKKHPFISDLAIDEGVSKIRQLAEKNNITLKSWYEVCQER